MRRLRGAAQAGGEPSLSLGMFTRPTARELRGPGSGGRVFVLWESPLLDEKRMTGESVNFRLNQMDLLLSSCFLHA